MLVQPQQQIPGSYTVTVSASGYQSKTSSAVTVTGTSVPNLNGTITIDKSSAETGEELTATYSGSETVSFQWKKDGTNVGTASTTNPNKYTPAEAGSYTVTVSLEGYQSKTSSAVTVTETSILNLTGTITIDKSSAETGEELTATYSGSETVSFQWKKNETNVGSASTTNPNKYTPAEAGSYTVTVSASGYESKTSSAVTVIWGDPRPAGALVSTPTLNAKTHNIITINAVDDPDNGQRVEYGINTANSAPSTWQEGLTFFGLTANTPYYIFARSGQNPFYKDGVPSASLSVTTDPPHNWNWAVYTSGSGLRECQDVGCSVIAGIGDTGPAGGIIYYADASGFYVEGYSGGKGAFSAYKANYLEAALENEGTGIDWGPWNTLINGITTFDNTNYDSDNFVSTDPKASLIGNGRKDTLTLVNHIAFIDSTGTAAQLCASKNLNGFADWFLPSLGELNKMNEAKELIGVWTGPSPVYENYWSSSQFNASRAWAQAFRDFGTVYQNGTAKEASSPLPGNVSTVRAIRAF